MKRLTILALAALFVLGSVISAAAAEIEASGDFRFQWVWSTNLDWMASDDDGRNEDDFEARQRFRVQIDITESENLRGVVNLEIGTDQWGRDDGAFPGRFGEIGQNGMIEVRRVFIDFNVPETDLQIRVGKFGLGLPNAVVGNPICDSENTTGIMLTYPINDMFAIAVVWARAVDLDDANNGADNDSEQADEMDVFGVVVPITTDYFSFSPYVLYADLGVNVQDALGDMSATRNNASFNFTQQHVNSGKTSTAWWAGFALDVSAFDPFWLGLDVAWGGVYAPRADSCRRGWYIAAMAAYRMDFMTPGILFWWTTGNDDDLDNGSEQLPHFGGGFSATHMAFDGGDLLDVNSNLDGEAEGTWGVAIVIQDITFIEDLSHDFRVAYVRGTDDEGNAAERDVNGLADSEWAWEIDFNTTYMIYENLSLVCEMGWSYLNLDEDVRAGNDDTVDAWKLGFGLQYEF